MKLIFNYSFDIKKKFFLNLESKKKTTTRIATTTSVKTVSTTIQLTTRAKSPMRTTTQDDSCEDHKCENNGTCIPYSKVLNKENLLSLKRLYLCDCLVGFSGSLCEKDLRPCSNYVCIHNSICESSIENPMEFKCKCQPNFEGLFCEENTICNNVTCQNGGYCIADYVNFSCMCSTYFSGQFCELKDSDLTTLQTVSKSFSAIGIIALSFWTLFLIFMDASRFMFKIEPEDLSKYRKKLKRKKLLKRINARIWSLMRRYKKIEKIQENFDQEEEKIIRNVKPRLIKVKKIKNDYSHFSVPGLKFIDDETDDDVDERHLDAQRFLNKLWLLKVNSEE